MRFWNVILASLLSVIWVTPAFTVLADSSSLALFFGTSQVRLAFVEQGIQTVDFRANTPTHSLAQTTAAIAPQISPDGNWIVYGSGPLSDMTNNAAKKSSAYLIPFAGGSPILAVPDSAHEPKFRRWSGSTQIIYSTLGVWNGWTSAGQTNTLTVDLTGSTPLWGNTTKLTNGTYYGGANASYVASGSPRAVINSLSKNNPIISLIYPLWSLANVLDTAARQACNPSIYPGSEYADVMMSLDFGSSNKSNPEINQGKSWGLHDILLLTNSQAQVVASYFRPNSSVPQISADSYVSHHFDDARWSNHPYFAVANLQVSRSYSNGTDWINEDLHEVIIALDLRTGAVLPLAQTATVGMGQTEDLQWPNLWLGNGTPVVEAQWMSKISSAVQHPKLLHHFYSHKSQSFDLLGRHISRGIFHE